jgi:hypothetical protein
MWRTSLVALVALAFTGSHGIGADPASTPQRHALLIGCTKYPNCKRIKTLNGPPNDVRLFSGILTERFGFEEKNIVRLVGWGDDPAHRPTHDNIVDAFEQLEKKATVNTQIVILMTGHGTQVPIPETQSNPLDAKNPEPDGLDEVFLPADVSEWSKNGLGNAIRDDQIGGWLDAMRNKGASVWILFDCCHSGTISRGDEISRSAEPGDLEVPLDVMKNLRTAAIPRDYPTEDVLAIERIGRSNSPEGSVTAFYAAQSFQRAPELPRPSGASRDPGNYYGLLTYVVSQALLEQPEGRSLTYRELSQIVLGRYRSERGNRGPNPAFDIRDNREVLGLTAKDWPRQSSLAYERYGGELRVVGGTVRGLTPGSVLKLASWDGGADASKPFAFVRVKSSSATAAVVEPCDHDGIKAVSIDAIPEIGRCELVSRDLGDMRIRVRILPSSDKTLAFQNAVLSESLERLPEASKAMIKKADADEPAWTLWLASPTEALAEGITLKQPKILLVHSDALTGVRKGQGDTMTAEAGVAADLSRLSAQYPIATAMDLAALFDEDIQRIFAWQCLWRLSGQMAGQSAEQDSVKIEVAAVRSADDPNPGEMLRGGVLHPGQFVEARVVNPSDEDMWVTVLFLGADHSIEVFVSDGVAKEKALSPFRFQINDSSYGNEGLIVLSMPMSQYRQEPDFRFLEQTGLGLRKRGGGNRLAVPEPTTPFGMLVRNALRGAQTRGPVAKAPENPDFTSWTWTTLPSTKQSR